MLQITDKEEVERSKNMKCCICGEPNPDKLILYRSGETLAFNGEAYHETCLMPRLRTDLVVLC